MKNSGIKKLALIILVSFIILVTCLTIVFFVLHKKEYKKTSNSIDSFNKQDTPVVVAYQEELLDGAIPELDENMIPVYYDFEQKVWKKADILEKWYSYEEQWWANVVIVKDDYLNDYKNMNAHEKIDLNKIYGFFVWIPRFEYKLFNVENELVPERFFEINIVSKEREKKVIEENGKYFTHPAFTANYKNGETYELNGFWIAKFEPSLDNEHIYHLPNKRPLVNLNMADMWNYATNIKNEYKLTTPSRIITNMEWGAIAYFSFSKYGKPGNNDFKNSNKRIYINNAMGSEAWDNLKTGCSSATVNMGRVSSCIHKYDVPIKGTGASSTGNIYGIYDLVGGAWECVMGLISSNNIPKNIGGYKGTPPSETRYYSLYKNGSMDNSTRGKLGDATRETKGSTNWNGSWYGNLSYFATSASPWIKRGGSFRGGGYSGLFDYGVTDAYPRGDKTFRVVLSKY